MTDKERIKAEIERLKATYDIDLPYGVGAYTTCETILSFIDSMPEEPISDDLERFAKRESDIFAEREYECDSYDRAFLSKGFYWGSKAGAQWQREQMIKDAVDVEEVGRNITNCPIYLTSAPLDTTKHGDKVKVIIVKEE